MASTARRKRRESERLRNAAKPSPAAIVPDAIVQKSDEEIYDEFMKTAIPLTPAAQALAPVVDESTSFVNVPLDAADIPQTPNGMLLRDALMASTMLHQAARPLREGLLLVNDGVRFRAADSKTFAFVLLDDFLNPDLEAIRLDWRPVFSLNGEWIVG
jgi:hypothetical protein